MIWKSSGQPIGRFISPGYAGLFVISARSLASEVASGVSEVTERVPTLTMRISRQTGGAG